MAFQTYSDVDLADSLEPSQIEAVIRAEKEIFEPGDYSFPALLDCLFSFEKCSSVRVIKLTIKK